MIEIDLTKLSDRDSQEVVGYFETLDIITESHKNIDIKESSIKNLHNILMKHSKKRILPLNEKHGTGSGTNYSIK